MISVTATCGLKIVRREFQTVEAAKGWAQGLTELGWVIRRERVEDVEPVALADWRGREHTEDTQ